MFSTAWPSRNGPSKNNAPDRLSGLTDGEGFGLGLRVVVLSVRFGSAAKRESGAPPQSGYAGAAPATVSGERLSNRATGAKKHWEGQAAAVTREPGNLPRCTNVLGRGVPVGRDSSGAAALQLRNLKGVCHDLEDSGYRR